MTTLEEWQHRLVVAVSEAEAALYRAQMAARKLRELGDPPAPETLARPSEPRSGPVFLEFLRVGTGDDEPRSRRPHSATKRPQRKKGERRAEMTAFVQQICQRWLDSMFADIIRHL